ncbi:EpsG family protein [Leuconostoc citreum]|uniref:EpsG family protein n=1 Tax=Leuconostoc citreum TaxID=33964 RepID=UPI0021A46D2A|nr:EpsG family protein [Leuconostoc citreum]
MIKKTLIKKWKIFILIKLKIKSSRFDVKKVGVAMIIFLYLLLFIVIIKYLILKVDSTTNVVNFILLFSIVIYAVLKIYNNQLTSNWGTDQYTYYYQFFLPLRGVSWPQFWMGNIGDKEFGFKLVLWLIMQVKVLSFLQFQIVTFIIETIPIFLVSIFINKNKNIDIIIFSFIMYPFFVNGATNVLRQGLAVGVLMAAYLWTIENINTSTVIKPISIASVLVAASFHQTAVILALLWIVVVFTRKKIKIAYFWLIAFIFTILALTNINQNLFGSIGSLFSDNYDLYINPDARINYGSSSKNSFIIISWLIAIILNFLLKKVDNINKNTAELLLKQYLGSMSAFFAFSFIAFADRVGMYAWAIAPMIAFYYIDNIKNEQEKRILLVLIPIFSILIGYGMSSGSYFVNR